MRKSILILSIFFCLGILILPNLSLAEDFHVIDYKKNSCEYEGNCGLDYIVGKMVSVAYYFLGISGSLALLMFVIGGVYWITSGGASDKVEQGKKIMTGAVIGIVIVFSAFLLIKVLEDVLGVEPGFRPAEMSDK